MSPDLAVGKPSTADTASDEASVGIRFLESADEKVWDQFVLGHREGSFFQLIGWKRVIEKTFDYQPAYALAEREGKITGILPLFSLSNWVMGRCLLSVPFGVYGGVCAEDEQSLQMLLDHSKQLAVAARVDFLELRNRGGDKLEGFHTNPLYCTFVTDLLPDPDAQFKRLPRDTRYMIRKAEKAGLRAQTGLELLQEFYDLFAENMRRHGTPLLSLQFFNNLTAEFGDRMHLLMVYGGGKPVAGVLSFLFRDTILPYYAGAGQEATRLAANNYMYWALMKEAIARGLRFFDFGRSKKGTGSYTFKTQWDMKMESLNYQVFLVERTTLPNFSPLNPKFEIAARVWKQLPAWLARRAGPRVVRWFP